MARSNLINRTAWSSHDGH